MPAGAVGVQIDKARADIEPRVVIGFLAGQRFRAELCNFSVLNIQVAVKQALPYNNFIAFKYINRVNFDSEILNVLKQLKHEKEYYVNMAVAWFYSFALISSLLLKHTCLIYNLQQLLLILD